MAVRKRVAAGASTLLSRDQLLDLYYRMRLTRTLEERLVALYRQTKVVGGLFRSLGQEADAVGSAYALERRDILSPLIRNLGAMLVKGATPLEILRQYMAKADSPTRGRELNIHFGDTRARLHRPDLAARRHGARHGWCDVDLQNARRGSCRSGVCRRWSDVHRRLPRRYQLRCRAALPARGDCGEQRLCVFHADGKTDCREAVRRQGDRVWRAR